MAWLHCQLSKAETDVPVQWLKEGVELHLSPKYEIRRVGTTCELLIHGLEPKDTGEYVCVAGGQKTMASVMVKGEPSLPHTFSLRLPRRTPGPAQHPLRSSTCLYLVLAALGSQALSCPFCSALGNKLHPSLDTALPLTPSPRVGGLSSSSPWSPCVSQRAWLPAVLARVGLATGWGWTEAAHPSTTPFTFPPNRSTPSRVSAPRN